MTYRLSSAEKTRLKNGILASYAIPFVDDIKDFVWEAIISYVKEDARALDPLTQEDARQKKLYDVVDNVNNIGWSAKSLQRGANVSYGDKFELVIQRADVFTKSDDLGYGSLNKNSDTQRIGSAVLEHWQRKILGDADDQGVDDMRTNILLKSSDRRRYAYYEDDIEIYEDSEILWEWTDSKKRGLQGIRKSDDFCVYRWYPNQTQLFERFELPREAYLFDLEPRRIGPPSEAVSKIVGLLEDEETDTQRELELD